MSDLITTHPSADFDGVASMVAARHLYPDAILAFSGSAEEKVRNFMRDCPADAPVAILNPKQVKRKEITRVILCDTHTPERAGHFEALCRRVPVHVFDHHPVEAGEPKPEQAVIEQVGATTTLLAERLRADKVTLMKWEATLMALGIYEETGSLTYASTTPRDIQAAAWLVESGANLDEVRSRLTTELTLEQLELLDALAHQMEVRYLDGYKIGVATAHASRYIPEVAGIANRILAIEPMDAVVILITMEEKVLLVGRGNRTDIRLGEVARRFGGGGHPTAASAMVHDKTVIEVAALVWDELERLTIPLSRAGRVMTTAAVTIDHAARLPEAEQVLTRYSINTLPVVKKKKLVGIISRETIQKGLHHKMENLPVSDLMESDPYTATPETPMREVQERMIADNRRFVPVVKAGVLLGCITRTDLLRTMHDDLRPPAGEALATSPYQRNIQDLMRRHLPAPVYRLLEEVGQAGEAAGTPVFMVGGIVRDLLLGHKNLDVDLVVEGEAIPFANNWAKSCGAHVHTHERFGTATVAVDRPGLPARFKLDLATARTEFYEYPSALPTVEHSSLKKDLYRRDFTINALAVSLTDPDFGTLIDYFGGQRDLKEKQIRVLHTLSFTEDPTRAIRATRFAVRYNFSIGSQTERLIRNAGKLGLFDKLSGKRLLTELIHLFSDADPVAGITTLGRMGVLTGIDPRLGDGTKILPELSRASEAIAWFHLQFFDRKLTAWQVYLLGLSDALAAEARPAFWMRLDLPGRLRREWEKWAHLPAQAEKSLHKDVAARPLDIYRILNGAPPEILVHLMAKTGSEPVKQAVSIYLSRIADITIAVTGEDLKALGIPEGPVYREIMEQLLSGRIEGKLESRADEIGWLKQAGYA